jgi:UDP-N-acetylmuramoylalanine--D-glutamate ligase
MGLGHFGGGVGVTRFLVKQGANVTITDMSDPETLADSLTQLQDLPVTTHLGEHREEDFLNTDLLVVNPAIPKSSPWLQLARQHNIAQTTEINLFFQRCPAPIIGVTGSNGKSTTVSMIAHILKTAQPDKQTWLGGNIGKKNLLQQIDQIQANDAIVLELSSFQLHDLSMIQRSPHIAVVTNISPNHLDWHGNMDNYIQSKQNILRYQKPNDHAIINRNLQAWPTSATPHYFSNNKTGDIELNIPGHHNQDNAAAALIVTQILNIDATQARSALQTFNGLEHRLEQVRTINGVAWINDSISTTPESTIAAINAFDEKKVLILGGTDKQTPFDQLVEMIAQPESNVETVILLGQTRDKLAQQITQTHKNHPDIKIVDTLDQAVTYAHTLNTTTLLSPACASYDMFKNFQERGNRFKALVNGLA